MPDDVLPPDALERAFDDAPLGMSLMSLDGRILRANAAFCRILSVAAGDIVGEFYAELLAEDPEPHRRAIARLISGSLGAYEREARHRTGDGRLLWLIASAAVVRDDHNRPQYLVNQVVDVSERREREERLRALADQDAVTGLANRRRFEREARRQLRYLARYGTSVALLLVDLDDFKAVNDTHGHLAGDRVLRELADILRGRLRSTDVVARFGGDELAVLLPEADLQTAARVADDLVEAVAGHVPGDGVPTVAVSIGVASTEHLAAPSLDALIAAADRGLYAAKAAGRGRARQDPAAP